jgi:hypothetical protein
MPFAWFLSDLVTRQTLDVAIYGLPEVLRAATGALK